MRAYSSLIIINKKSLEIIRIKNYFKENQYFKNALNYISIILKFNFNFHKILELLTKKNISPIFKS
jgi:hypothetical protein